MSQLPASREGQLAGRGWVIPEAQLLHCGWTKLPFLWSGVSGESWNSREVKSSSLLQSSDICRSVSDQFIFPGWGAGMRPTYQRVSDGIALSWVTSQFGSSVDHTEGKASWGREGTRRQRVCARKEDVKVVNGDWGDPVEVHPYLQKLGGGCWSCLFSHRIPYS